ncbi:NAD(P)-dependent oxidoreductase [Amycolatopsis nigrescens]|uniref:NAD(P)-dependent oxidoreductase n=1 Tax=Amycolatopsis nigrescens TaxID=381445 RepID=UPI000366AD58|nr:NAD(P)-dependent oxidoreductase [Amycolatopsis nigrescens]
MTTRVTVLGTGLMGAGMARSMARAGLDVTVWNRSQDRARPLAADGIRVATDAGAAVSGADVVLTMLFDVDAVERVVAPLLPTFDGALWVQAGTVGLEGTERLAGLAARHGVRYLDAPVLGTRQPAEQGALTVLAGGPPELRETAAPVFEAIGSRTVWVGDRPGDGQRLKLAANAWVLSITGATAQSVALAGALGIDPQRFLDVIANGPMDSGYAQAKGKAMITGDFSPAFPVSGAVKDSGLIADALKAAGAEDALMLALRNAFEATAESGLESADMAAVVRAFRASQVN